MIELAETQATGRVLVVVDGTLRNHKALTSAAALAAQEHMELVGLFIEDINLLHLAQLPFAIEVDRASAEERRFDDLQISRMLRRGVQELSASLDRLAREFGVRASLQVSRGYFLSEALAACTALDFLFLNRIGHRSEGGIVKRVWSEQKSKLRESIQPVLVILDDAESAKRVLIAATYLLRPEQAELLVLLPSEKASSMADTVQELLRAYEYPSRIKIIANRDLATLSTLMRHEHCGLLVLERAQAERLGLLSLELLQALECPVVLVPSLA